MFTEQEKNLIDLLKTAKEILDRHNIEFWLEGGTLLGAIRDEKFIPWENDIDLGMWANNISNKKRILLSKDFYNRGFKVLIYKEYINIKKTVNFWLDFDFYQFKDGYAIYPAFYPKNLLSKYLFILSSILLSPSHPYDIDKLQSLIKRLIMKAAISVSLIIPSFLRKRIASILLILYKKVGVRYVPRIAPSKYFKNLSKIEFYGMEFKAPSHTEEYLAYKYGKDWRIPRKNWIAERDDGMVIKFLSRPIIRK
jgi:lipopolysaccharide cholinephosphotransferase